MKFGWSDLITNFSPDRALGPKIRKEHYADFLDLLKEAVEAHEVAITDPSGMYFIWLPHRATEISECGIGRRTMNPDDYVIRPFRGRM